MHILILISTVGASPQKAKYYHFVTFLTALSLFIGHELEVQF